MMAFNTRRLAFYNLAKEFYILILNLEENYYTESNIEMASTLYHIGNCNRLLWNLKDSEGFFNRAINLFQKFDSYEDNDTYADCL